MLEDIFKRRRPDTDRLVAYGFCKWLQYEYSVDIMDGRFMLAVTVGENGDVSTAVTEKESGEPYVLYKTDASGAFVGRVRAEIETVLRDIDAKCFRPAVFKSDQALMLIDYIREKYGDEPEFLWNKLPDCAVWRRNDDRKWYGIIMTLQRSKLGINSDEKAEIIDLRLSPDKMDELIDGRRYFPGWHMNKKHWYTICLDGSVPDDELRQRIDESFRLAKK